MASCESSPGLVPRSCPPWFAKEVSNSLRLKICSLDTVLKACESQLPQGTRFTRPEGGMNLWVELPAPLMAEDLLKAAEERRVSFLAGNCFSVRRTERRGLRISFGGLSPDDITSGI